MNILVVLSLFATVTYGGIIPVSLDDRIAGGELAEVGQFPYVVSLAKNGKHACGGAILNSRWILTAAHCIKDLDPATRTILAGTTRRSVNGTVYNVSLTIMHDPVWDADNFGNDIGLLRLSSDIIFTDLIQPIPMNPSYILPDTELILAGWGRINDDGHSVDDLQWIALKSITQEQCQQSFQHVIRDYMLCTFTKKGEGSCKGDSGSSLVVDGKIAGVTSWGKGCGKGNPNVFTRVASFFKWVEDTMREYNDSEEVGVIIRK